MIDYILYGLKKVKTNAENSNNLSSLTENELIQFFENIEDFKHCEDEITAGGLIDSLGLTLDHVPGHLLKSQSVCSFLFNLKYYFQFFIF